MFTSDSVMTSPGKNLPGKMPNVRMTSCDEIIKSVVMGDRVQRVCCFVFNHFAIVPKVVFILSRN